MSKCPKLNILVAFPYFSKKIYEKLMELDPSTFRLIVDSGAFTAWNTGKQISLDDYAKFLKSIPSHWDYKAVQLDVYGDPEQTYINYMRMLDMGYADIMPVFTRGDSLERLEEFYSYTDYIMFGGIAIGGQNTNYVKWFCEMNKGRHAHWVGFVNVPFIKHYKPYSVDSSSIKSSARFGNLQIYAGNGNLKSINKKEFSNIPSDNVIEMLKKHGLTLSQILLLQNNQAWSSNAKAFKYKSQNGIASFITYLGHTKRAIEVEKNLGTKIYQALSSEGDVVALFDALEFLKETNSI